MNLRERLRLIQPAASSAPPSPTSPSPLLHAASPATSATESDFLAGVVEGCLLPTPAGPAFCVEHSYPAGYMQGTIDLGAILQVPERGWARLAPARAGHAFPATTAAIVDTETTGLERGAGTYTFLIGIGRFTGNTFRVRQFFMRDYHEEPAVLLAVLAELEGAGGLISFNGRSFDWPLLQTRATLSRLALPELPHLDLLYPARRLWRPVTQSCRLMQLEAEILGLTRQDDIPGYLIPQLYFDFVRTGDAAPMAGVIDHNRLDILTTAALAGYLGHAAADPLRAAPAGHPLPGSDLHGVGCLLLAQGDLAEGIACLEEALQRGLPTELRHVCQRQLGTVYRQVEQHEHAVEIWQTLTNESGISVFPHIELAKYYEHRAKDLRAAREWTLQALEVLQRRRLLRGLGGGSAVETLPDQEIGAILHRLQRLDAKLARQAAVYRHAAN